MYRAQVPDWGAGPASSFSHSHSKGKGEQSKEEKSSKCETQIHVPETEEGMDEQEVGYELSTMRWGLVPSWTKRNPEYGSMLKTINCRDDSLAENRGMWNAIKGRKRCVVICQGFYEWLKKDGGREKIPHFIKRKAKDGAEGGEEDLMLLAGLWDCCTFEGEAEKRYTFTIITTDSNPQLKFLHDRMPVVLQPDSEALKIWLDPRRYSWSKELQGVLKPYMGDLEVYPVAQEVGKVGNDSPNFIVPVGSKENRQSIENFFGRGKGGELRKGKEEGSEEGKKVNVKREDMEEENTKQGVKKEEDTEEVKKAEEQQVKKEPDEHRQTVQHEGKEDNAPIPVPQDESKQGVKHKIEDVEEDGGDKPSKKIAKSTLKSPTKSSPRKETSPVKPTRKTRSATSKGTVAASPGKGKDKGSQKITGFFK